MDSGKRASMREGPSRLSSRTDSHRRRSRRSRASPRRPSPSSARSITSRAWAASTRPSRARRRPSATRRSSSCARRRRRRARCRRSSPSPSRTSPSAEERLRGGLLLGHPREHHGARAHARALVLASARGHPALRARGAARPALPSRCCSRVLRVVGVGGAGVNAVNRMIEAQVEGVEFIAINTDLQSLQQSSARHHAAHRQPVHARARLGLESRARPPGRAGGLRPDQGACSRARTWCSSRPAPAAAPAPARRPWWRGSHASSVRSPSASSPSRSPSRARAAASRPSAGIEELSREVDTLIVIPNSRLLSVLDKRTSMVDAFRHGRRRAAPGRAGHLRPDHAAGPHQPRLRRRAHDHGRRRSGAARHRHGRGRVAARWTRPTAPWPRRCSRPRWRARARSCCRSPAAATCRCGRSTRPPRRSRRPPTPTPTSSSAPWSTRRSWTRSG